MSIYDPAYDNQKRWDVACGYPGGCDAKGEWYNNPTSPAALRNGIYCPRHARQAGRHRGGRESSKSCYTFCKPVAVKRRLREEARNLGRPGAKRIDQSPYKSRQRQVKEWLSKPFEELSTYDTDIVLSQLRIPDEMLEYGNNRTRVYLLNSFPLEDLQYLYKKRSDGRRLILARCNRVIFFRSPHSLKTIQM